MPDAPIGEWTVRQFLDAVASDEPVPGGGAGAALAGAGAAALLHMVASLALRRATDPAVVASLTSHRGKARAQERQFLDLADDDVAAYRGVMSALALPRATPQEKAHRAAALHQALARAAEVPLATARLATDALALASEVAPFCPPVARSDLATAVHLARAAAEAAVANVDANALCPLRGFHRRARSGGGRPRPARGGPPGVARSTLTRSPARAIRRALRRGREPQGGGV